MCLILVARGGFEPPTWVMRLQKLLCMCSDFCRCTVGLNGVAAHFPNENSKFRCDIQSPTTPTDLSPRHTYFLKVLSAGRRKSSKGDLWVGDGGRGWISTQPHQHRVLGMPCDMARSNAEISERTGVRCNACFGRSFATLPQKGTVLAQCGTTALWCPQVRVKPY